MGEVAPYLVALPFRHSLTQDLFATDGVVQPLWCKNAAVFLIASQDIDVVCTHLRRFTKLRDSDGGWVSFRFFTPSTHQGIFPLMQQDRDFAAAWFGQDIIHDLFHQVPARDQIA